MHPILCSIKTASFSLLQLMKTHSAAGGCRYNPMQNLCSLGCLKRFNLQDKVSPSVSEGLGSCIPGSHLTCINITSPSVFIPLWQFGDTIDMESKGTRLVLLHWSRHTGYILTSWDLVEWFISAVELIQGPKLFLPGIFLSNYAFSCFYQKYLFLKSYRVNKPGIFKEVFV